MRVAAPRPTPIIASSGFSGLVTRWVDKVDASACEDTVLTESHRNDMTQRFS